MNSPHFFDIPSHTTDPFLPNQPPSQLVCINSEGYEDYRGEWAMIWRKLCQFSGNINWYFNNTLTFYFFTIPTSKQDLLRPNQSPSCLVSNEGERGGEIWGEFMMFFQQKIRFASDMFVSYSHLLFFSMPTSKPDLLQPNQPSSHLDRDVSEMGGEFEGWLWKWNTTINKKSEKRINFFHFKLTI